jgi:hypothetical protein
MQDRADEKTILSVLDTGAAAPKKVTSLYTSFITA